MIEIRVIPDSDGNYFVSDKGVVFSRTRHGKPELQLTQRINNNGYLYVDLFIEKKKKKGLIHRLVALAFLDNPQNKPCVNHKDGNKMNNCVENLEWCTYSENMKHAVSMGLSRTPNLSGEKHPMHKLTEENVRQIKRLSLDGTSSPQIAKQFGITKEQVYNIIKGYHWRDVV